MDGEEPDGNTSGGKIFSYLNITCNILTCSQCIHHFVIITNSLTVHTKRFSMYLRRANVPFVVMHWPPICQRPSQKSPHTCQGHPLLETANPMQNSTACQNITFYHHDKALGKSKNLQNDTACTYKVST